MSFHRVLIANRGEIARRVVRTCNDLGIESVAVFSDADAGAPWLNEATFAIRLPGNAAAETYLDQDLILRVAREASCEAIHPGYGFLAESAAFARRCEQSGVAFVGPPSTHIVQMGEKRKAQDAFGSVGFPVLSRIDIENPDSQPDESLFPIMLKANSGGGGIGMTLVHCVDDLARAIARVRSAGVRYFGSGDLYAERFLANARHVEVQVVGDSEGSFHVGERDCSWQRRYQKVVEESPAAGLSANTVSRLTATAALATGRLGYSNVGTIECLVTGDDFFFLEMNTRIQVEHPVTEMVYGVDLVKWQLQIAAGERIVPRERMPLPSGHAIEFRVYAEDPETHIPSPGTIEQFEIPSGEGIRIETGYSNGSTVPMYYDPLVAKVVVHGPTRDTAIRRGKGVLEAMTITGIKTNLPLLRHIASSEPFVTAQYHTASLSELLATRSAVPVVP